MRLWIKLALLLAFAAAAVESAAATGTLPHAGRSSAPQYGSVLIETLSVSAASPLPVETVSSLTQGAPYEVVVSGTFTFSVGSPPDCVTECIADAEYYSRDGWSTVIKDFFYPPTGEVIPHVNDLLVDGQQPEWGAFDALSHTYRLTLEGQGSPVSFVISDWYGPGPYPLPCENNSCMFDNSGALLVRIFEASPPVGGVAHLPDVAGTPLEARGSSGPGAGVLAGIAVAAGGVALGGVAWYARRRLSRRG